MNRVNQEYIKTDRKSVGNPNHFETPIKEKAVFMSNLILDHDIETRLLN